MWLSLWPLFIKRHISGLSCKQNHLSGLIAATVCVCVSFCVCVWVGVNSDMHAHTFEKDTPNHMLLIFPLWLRKSVFHFWKKSPLLTLK